MMFTQFKNRFFKPSTGGAEVKSPYETKAVARLFWLWALILFVVVSTISFSYISLTVKSIEDDVSRVHIEVAMRAAAVIEDSLGNLINMQSRMGLDIADPSRNKDATLALFMRVNPEFNTVSLVGLDGTTLLSRDRYTVVDKSQFKTYSGQADFLQVLKGTNSIGSVFISNLGDPQVTIITPVTSLGGVVEGAIVADLNLKFMWKLVAGIQVGASGKVYVVDQNGNLIADPDSSVVLQRENLLSRPIVKKVLSGPQVVDGLDPALRYVSNGTEMFSTGLQISPYGWGVITEEPISEALLASQRTQTAGIIFSVSVALLLLVLMVIVQRLITSNKRTNEINAKLDTNVSLLTKREEELTLVNDRLRELDEAKSEFISVAAHQLRTPLSAIKWTLSLLIDENSDNLTSEQKSLLMKGNESNERIINLVNEMLVVTRIESGKMQYNFSLIHVEDLIDSVLLDFAEQAHVRNVTLVFERPSTQLQYVNADPEKIRAVIQNLIENALNYTKDGGTITLSTQLENKFIKVSVKDNGIGIPVHQQASIFNKFFRADNAVKTKTDGSGLGLFVSKSIVDKHGGEIGFESTEGVGTTFHFTVPCADVHP